VAKKSRAGISNLGNTCYINASIQAILSVCKSEYLEKPKGTLGKLLKEIDQIVREQKKSMFPIDFKIEFEKHFPDFKGKDQHDAHEFCMCLFQKFEDDNK
jgi:ubiquitin C-terminal hydrolase